MIKNLARGDIMNIDFKIAAKRIWQRIKEDGPKNEDVKDYEKRAQALIEAGLRHAVKEAYTIPMEYTLGK